MKIYLVGGAVRDQLLGRAITERDWVVVGARPDDLLAQGFRAVGRDFPVFLHPTTQEEYALARTEKKTGAGHTDFICAFSPSITLEEDLIRRDLTINAMAENEHGELTDPYGGQRDLSAKILRHVSPAFCEDPLRVFRVARFAARYASLGFTIAPETILLMKKMVSAGEITALTPERVWKETERALSEDAPHIYIEVLRECGALAVWFPEINHLFGVPQRPEYHPEIDTGVHTLLTLKIAAQLSPEPRLRYAALVHDLGKADTPQQEWPRHIGHESLGIPRVRALSKRLKAPTAFSELGELVSRFHLDIHRGADLRAATVLKKLIDMDALRRPDRYAEILLACEADARGRLGLENKHYVQKYFWQGALAALRSVSAKEIQARGLTGQDFIKALHHEREEAMKKFKHEWKLAQEYRDES